MFTKNFNSSQELYQLGLTKCMDTSKDFRILIAEKGAAELEKLLQNVKVQRRKELVSLARNLTNEIQVLKYSYMPPEELAKSCGNLLDLAKEISKTLANAEEDFNKRLAEYWLDYISSLPDLFERGEIERIGFAIRYFSGEIVSANKISNKLWLCVVDCGKRFDVVTNSEKLASSERVVVSHLPPRKFGDVVSDGMFVDASFEKKGELSFDEIKSIADKLGEVEAVLYQIVER